MDHDTITHHVNSGYWATLRGELEQSGIEPLKEHEAFQTIATRMKQLYSYDAQIMAHIEGIELLKPEKDGETLLKELADKHDLPDDLRKYLFDGVTAQNYSSFYYWDDMISDLVAAGISLEDDAVKKICKIACEIDYGSSYVFTTLQRLQPGTEAGYRYLIDLFLSAGADPAAVSYRFFDHCHPGKASFMPYVQALLLPDYESELVTMAAEHGTRGYFAMRLLIQHDYEAHQSTIALNLGNRERYHKHDLYSIIPDDELIKTTIRQEIVDFINQTAKPASLLTKLLPVVENYYDTGEQDSKFDELLIKYRKKFKKYGTKFYEALLSGGAPDLTKTHYQRLYQLCLKIDPVNTLNEGFQVDSKFDEEQIKTYLENFKEVVPEVAVFLAQKSDGYSSRDTYKKYLKVLNQINPEETRKGLEGDNKVLAIAIPCIAEPVEDNYQYLLSIAQKGPTIAIREALEKVLGGYEPGFEDFKGLLKGKKQAVRAAGIALLGSFIEREAEVVAIFNEHQKTESASEPSNLIRRYFNWIAEEKRKRRLEALKTFEAVDFEREASENSEEMVEKIKKAGWVSWENIPEMRWKVDQNPLSREAVAYLFGHMIEINKYDYDSQTNRFLSLIVEEDLAKAGAFLYEGWGFEQKNGWFFPLLIRSGSKTLADQLVEIYKANIDGDMGGQSYVDTREAILRAIGSLGSYSGFRLLNRIAYMGKKDRYAASNALREGCRKLKLDSNVQSDFLVPDFGFSPEGILELDYGKRQFSIRIMSDYSYQVQNQDGRSYKNLPKPGKTDDPEASKAAAAFFKQVKEDLRNQIKRQRKRLEAAMVEQRSWNVDDWKFIFMDHPVFRPLATTLIWGIYVDDQLTETFRATEEGSLCDREDEPFELPERGEIRLVHRLLLDDDLVDEWREQLEDYELKQPFLQLDRPVFTLSDDQKELTEVADFVGHIVLRIALRSKMEQFGWNRGPVEDAGMIYTYYKYQNGYELTLNYHGEYVGYGDRMAPTALKSFTFYDREAKKIVALGEIPPILYSETYRAVKTIADGGTGYSEDWENLGY